MGENAEGRRKEDAGERRGHLVEKSGGDGAKRLLQARVLGGNLKEMKCWRSNVKRAHHAHYLTHMKRHTSQVTCRS